ncbi:MAG: heparan-alpha-glucosaminide N-acetyltransferase domain-containing protein [Caldiserica bacterium]|nr:heparan-alpha-glucosaminide N-acetyltransferase domain-containing protein [Caldisericota bacterium]
MNDAGHRLESIDEFRGFSILLMVLADYLAGPAVVPAWLKHPSDIGFTVIDVIAPMFITAIGLTFGLSFRTRLARDGRRKTIEHFLARNLALIGLGALFTVLGNISGAEVDYSNWGLLQAIGVAGLIALVFISIPARLRWFVGFLLLAIYQFLLNNFWLSSVLSSTHGGLEGAFSWGAMLVMATALGDLFHDVRKGRRWFPAVSTGVLILGLLLALVIPVSKHRVSASYVLLSLGISALVFWCFHLIDQRLGRSVPILRKWGRNSLLLYLLHGALLGVFVMPGASGWYELAPAWLVVLQALFMVGTLSWVGWVLDRRHFHFAL